MMMIKMMSGMVVRVNVNFEQRCISWVENWLLLTFVVQRMSVD